MKADVAGWKARSTRPIVQPVLPWAAMSIEFMQPSKYARAGLGWNGPAPAPPRPLPTSVAGLLPKPGT